MSNPILNEDRFSSQERILDGEPMTIQGTVSKIFMLFACLIAGSAISVYSLFTNPGLAYGLMFLRPYKGNRRENYNRKISTRLS